MGIAVFSFPLFYSLLYSTYEGLYFTLAVAAVENEQHRYATGYTGTTCAVSELTLYHPMSDKSDILVLGATGFTGSLITGYLSTHPQRSQFSLALGARSPTKIKALVEKLKLSESSVKLVQVDITDEAGVERAVCSTRVVINTVGPYWRWGTPVVRCVYEGLLLKKIGLLFLDLVQEMAFTMLI